MSKSNGGEGSISIGTAQAGAFRQCAALHGLRLHRVHFPALARTDFEATMVFDCNCGLRWLVRAKEGDVISADAETLEAVTRERGALAPSPF